MQSSEQQLHLLCFIRKPRLLKAQLQKTKPKIPQASWCLQWLRDEHDVKVFRGWHNSRSKDGSRRSSPKPEGIYSPPHVSIASNPEIK